MGADFIASSFDFIANNILNIIIVALGILLMVSYIAIHDVKFPKSNPKLKKVVVVETMENKPTFNQMLRKGFCSSTLGDSMQREKHCGVFKEEQCSLVDCCVWARQKGSKKFKCVAGGKAGPTYNGMKTEEYYYLGKPRGGRRVR